MREEGLAWDACLINAAVARLAAAPAPAKFCDGASFFGGEEGLPCGAAAAFGPFRQWTPVATAGPADSAALLSAAGCGVAAAAAAVVAATASAVSGSLGASRGLVVA